MAGDYQGSVGLGSPLPCGETHGLPRGVSVHAEGGGAEGLGYGRSVDTPYGGDVSITVGVGRCDNKAAKVVGGVGAYGASGWSGNVGWYCNPIAYMRGWEDKIMAGYAACRARR